jgi:hypothetical protein
VAAGRRDVAIGDGRRARRARRRERAGIAFGLVDERVVWFTAIVTLLAVATQLPGPAFLTGDGSGPRGLVSAAGLLLVAIGMLVGLQTRRYVVPAELDAHTQRTRRVAWIRYLLAIPLLVALWGVTHLPGVDAGALATRGETGPGGTVASFASTPGLGDYPVPPRTVFDLILFRVGPAQLDIVLLVVMLSLVVPPVVSLIVARRTQWVLLVSWLLWAANLALDVRPVGAAFEGAYPLLSWQVVLVTGLAVGMHWTAVARWVDGPAGRLLTAAAVVGSTVALAWPAAAATFGAGGRWSLTDRSLESWSIPGGDWLADPTLLGPGRLLALAAICLTALALLSGMLRLSPATARSMPSEVARAVGTRPVTVLLVAVPVVVACWLVPGTEDLGGPESALLRTLVAAFLVLFFTVIPALWRRGERDQSLAVPPGGMATGRS